jgi:hypothetical protein
MAPGVSSSAGAADPIGNALSLRFFSRAGEPDICRNPVTPSASIRARLPEGSFRFNACECMSL